MVAIYGVSGLLTVLVMLFVPAAGAMEHLKPPHEMITGWGTGHLTQFLALRTLKPFSITTIEGLVTFPSFHAALGFLFIYITRNIRFVAAPVLIVNAAMIVSTVPIGGHYLIDVICGGLVTLFAIMSVNKLDAWKVALAPTTP